MCLRHSELKGGRARVIHAIGGDHHDVVPDVALPSDRVKIHQVLAQETLSKTDRRGALDATAM